MSCQKNYGLGHLIRSLTLAKKLKKKEQVTFLIDYCDNKIRALFPKNINIIKNANAFENPNNLIKILNKYKYPKLIIDSYKIKYSFEKKIKIYCKLLVIIDDLKKRHICDIYINPNDFSKSYLGKINSKIKLIGLDYLILDIKNNLKKYRRENKKILVFMGARDSKNLTVKLYQIIKSYDIFKKFYFTFVIGPFNSKKKFFQIHTGDKNIKIMYFVKNFQNLLAQNNIFISAGGSSIWQALHMKLKVLVFPHSSKQKENSENLSKKFNLKVFNKVYTKKLMYIFLKNKITKKNNKSFLKFKSNGVDKIAKYILEY